MFKFAALCLPFLLISCVQTSTRTIQNTKLESPDDFNRDPRGWIQNVIKPTVNEFCESKIVNATQLLKSLDFETLDLNFMKNNGEEWLRQRFQVEVDINSQLPTISDDCKKNLVSFLRELRQVEDYVGAVAYNVKDQDPFKIDFKKVPPPLLNAKSYSPYFLNEKYRTLQFEAGDVLVTRGISFVSATISQSTDDQTHFTHGVFVSRDQKGNLRTIESYLQRGVEYYTLEDAMKNENARILVFRSRDPVLAKKADEVMSRTLDDKGNIPYDYSLDYTDHSRMSCAEVVVSAYEWASNGQFKIPYQQSQIKFNKPYVLEKLSAKKGPTFSPINMELDPRFELVLEWRDYSLIRDQRQKDMILRSMFQWMENENYELHGSLSTAVLKAVWASRNTRLWNLLSKPLDITNVPADTPRNFLVTIAQLRGVGELILEKVKAADLKYSKINKYPMGERQLLEYLEKLKADDAYNYINNRPVIFHHLMRPRNMVPEVQGG